MLKRERETSEKLGLFMSPEQFKYACKKAGVEIRSMNYMGGTFRKRYDLTLYCTDIEYLKLVAMLSVD